MKRIVNSSLSIFNNIQFFRFLIVGGINTMFGYGCFAIFIFLEIHYTISVLLSTICGILFNFKTIGIIVFKNKDNNLFFRFLYIYGFLYLCNIACIKIMLLSGVNIYIAGALLILPMAVLAFFLNKRFVFTTRSNTVS